MTELSLAAASDADLSDRVRSGDTEAFATLYRRHVDVAKRAALRIAPATAADDVVSEAFTKVFVALRDGAGPRMSFRSYLLACVNSAWIDQVRRDKHTVAVGEDLLIPLLIEDDSAPRINERQLLAEALSSLPPRWQQALWLTEVENLPTREAATLLGMTPNGLAALAMRARRGLHEAYLRSHLETASRPECRPIVEALSAYVAGRSRLRANRLIESHLPDCVDCTTTLSDLRDARANLGGVLAPAVLGMSSVGHELAWQGLVGQGPIGQALAGQGLAGPAASSTQALTKTGAIGGKVAAIPAAVKAAAAVGVLAAAGLGAWVTVSGDAAPAPAEVAVAPRAPVHPGGLSTPAPSASPDARPPAARPTDSATARSTHSAATTAPASRAGAASTPASTTAPTTRAPAAADPTSTPAVKSGAATGPRLGVPQVVDSPRGDGWKRVNVPVAGAVPGVKVAVSAVGALAYCADSRCTQTSATTTWLADLAVPRGSSTLAIDVRPGASTNLRLHLTGSGWDDPDPDDNSAQATVPE